MDVLSEEEVSMQDARVIMEERKKLSDMTYEQKVCHELLEKLPKLTEKQLADLKEELGKMAILKPRYTSLIINMMPDTEEEVELLFQKERTNLKKEEIKQIVGIVKNFKK
ncbi:MAG: hypothetical protein HYW25_06110 [Candidatus Aenigmarchaeota archaeon]|nr:hypothetical protein [Candidatus Aenigmarchaeota archaeon]